MIYDRTFFKSQLGKASFASIAAMTAMIALTSQMNLVSQDASLAQPQGQSTILVELA